MTNMKYYIKIDDDRLVLVDGGLDQPQPNVLSIQFYNEERFTFEDVKRIFGEMTDISIWMCLVQDDGTETDEMLSNNYTEYTKLKAIDYQMDLDLWKVSMTVPNDEKERISDLEDALNFLLMGGDM